MNSTETATIDIASLQAAFESLRSNVDYGWTIMGSALVFVMQIGFGMLEAGATRSKNTQNIMLKKVLDICVGGVTFATVGYGLGFGTGPSDGEGAGFQYFFLDNMFRFDNYLVMWIFCCIAATIVSGAIAERTRMISYAIYVVWIVGFVYPFIVRWVWNPAGWLSKLGVHDFAGSGVVHVTGGTAAIMACIMVGPRLGRFEANGKANEIRAHSMSLYWLGSMLLFFGWFFFNGVSSLGLSGTGAGRSGRAMVNTAIGGCSGGVAAFLLYWALHRVQRLDVMLSGVLAGCVGITANCDVIHAWAAWFIGSVAGCIYVGSSKLVARLQIDDCVDAIAVHMFCGAWGTIATGLFHGVNGIEPHALYGAGAFYGRRGNETYANGTYLGVQILEVVIIMLWTSITVGLLFFVLKKLKLLRVSESEELAGLDVTSHGGSAYSASSAKPAAAKSDASTAPSMPSMAPSMPMMAPSMPVAADWAAPQVAEPSSHRKKTKKRHSKRSEE